MVKKIALIIVAVVGLTLVLSLFIPRNFKTEFDIDDVQDIRIFQGSATIPALPSIWSDKEGFTAMMNRIDESFSASIAHATIKGLLFAGPTIKYENIGSVTNAQLLGKTDATFIEIRFHSVQTMLLNGKEYIDTNFATSRKVTYDALLMEVSSSASLHSVKLYAVLNKSVQYHYQTYAVQNSLYNYIQNLIG